MIALLRRHRKALFIAVIAIFLIGIFVGLGGYFFTENDMTSTVASVGKVKIPYARYMARVNQYSDALRSRGTELSDEMMLEIKQGVLRDMIVDELLNLKAEEMGLVVPDGDLARDIQNTPYFMDKGAFSQELYFMRVRSVFRDTPEAYEKERRKQLRTARLKQLVFQTAKLTPAEIDEVYEAAKAANDKAGKAKAKDFPDKTKFAAQAQQQRALELINHYLRQLSSQVEIRSYLEQRERGA